MRTPRIRYARHRDFDGAERGATATKRLQRHNLFLINRVADAADDGIGDTAALDAFVVENLELVAAAGVLTATGNPTGLKAAVGTLTGTTIAADDTVTIGTREYMFVDVMPGGSTLPVSVLVGATDSDSLDNLIAALNAAAGGGTLYSINTAAHSQVTAAVGAGDTMVVTAKTRGAAANAIVTTATLTAGDWGAATLEGGVDGETVTIGEVVYTYVASPLVDTAYNVLVGGSASASLDNLIDAINAEDGAGEEGTLYGTGTIVHPDVEAAAGAGDTVDVTALVPGLAGNLIASVCDPEDDISFAAATLVGGELPETMTAVAHGLATGDGPFLLTSTTTLPDGLSASVSYWVSVINDDTLRLHRSRREAVFGTNPADLLDAGTGTHSFALGATRPAMNDYLRQGVQASQLAALTDVDDVRDYF